MVIQKDVFWKSAILTFVVLIVGIQIGIWLDSGRIDEIKNILTETELQFSDARLQSLYYDKFSMIDENFCKNAIESNLKFNEDIYQEGLRIEKAETVNRFTPFILSEKRRYALLQFQFWINAITIKEKCESNYTTILYIYTYETKDNSTLELNQKLQSAILLDLKDKCGNSVMLSPIPWDINLTSVDILVKDFEINQTPAIVINRNVTLQGLTKLEELERYIKC